MAMLEGVEVCYVNVIDEGGAGGEGLFKRARLSLSALHYVLGAVVEDTTCK
jgi:hypothetical protein